MFLGASFRKSCGLMLLLEDMERGDLSLYLTQRESLNPKECWKIARNISTAMVFLHSCKPAIVHGNLTPENVFIDKYGTAKVANFSLSGFEARNSAKPDKSQLSSVRYLAPENLLKFRGCLKSDVYSFGMILADLFSNAKPKSGARRLFYVDYVELARSSKQPPLPQMKNRHASEIALRCVQYSAEKRPSFQSVHEEIERNIPPNKCIIV
mmetsp:Transcript_35/g.79  ORF Transcript_35/g.79 Transcript_35/m.79 type:complete len:210 (-) Transcript_35:268-897(-)